MVVFHVHHCGKEQMCVLDVLGVQTVHLVVWDLCLCLYPLANNLKPWATWPQVTGLHTISQIHGNVDKMTEDGWTNCEEGGCISQFCGKSGDCVKKSEGGKRGLKTHVALIVRLLPHFWLNWKRWRMCFWGKCAPSRQVASIAECSMWISDFTVLQHFPSSCKLDLMSLHNDTTWMHTLHHLGGIAWKVLFIVVWLCFACVNMKKGEKSTEACQNQWYIESIIVWKKMGKALLELWENSILQSTCYRTSWRGQSNSNKIINAADPKNDPETHGTHHSLVSGWLHHHTGWACHEVLWKSGSGNQCFNTIPWPVQSFIQTSDSERQERRNWRKQPEEVWVAATFGHAFLHNPRSFFFMDKVGFSVSMCCAYGYAPHGVHAKMTVPAIKSCNLTIMAFIGKAQGNPVTKLMVWKILHGVGNAAEKLTNAKIVEALQINPSILSHVDIESIISVLLENWEKLKTLLSHNETSVVKVKGDEEMTKKHVHSLPLKWLIS